MEMGQAKNVSTKSEREGRNEWKINGEKSRKSRKPVISRKQKKAGTLLVL
jgi:hypothetical protein